MVNLALVTLLPIACFAKDKPKADNSNVRVYADDLNGDERKEVVEVENISTAEPMFLVKVKNRGKKAELIDSFSVAGKITKIEFAKLNIDEDKSIVVYFDDKDDLYNIAIYKLKKDKFFKIFSAGSEYPIETEFISMARIKIGKPPQDKKSPNLVPDWDNWIWTGGKFVLD